MGRIPAFNYVAEQTIGSGAVVGGSIGLGDDNITAMSFHNVWGGTLQAIVTFEGSNDPRAFQGHKDYDSADWVDITSAFSPSQPVGVAGSALELLSGIAFDFVRMTVTWVAGSGTFKSLAAGRG